MGLGVGLHAAGAAVKVAVLDGTGDGAPHDGGEIVVGADQPGGMDRTAAGLVLSTSQGVKSWGGKTNRARARGRSS